MRVNSFKLNSLTEVQIAGSGQIVFGGVYHALNKTGRPLCKCHYIKGRLYSDEWIGPNTIDQIIARVSCKNCNTLLADDTRPNVKKSEYTIKITCPFCFWELPDSANYNLDDGLYDEFKCEDCWKKFFATSSTRVLYVSKKPDEIEDGAHQVEKGTK